MTEGAANYYPDYREYPMAEAEADDALAKTPVTAGELEVTASVTIIYEIQ